MARVYHFDPNLGSLRDTYRRADQVHAGAAGPEVAGVFTARVEGETTISTMWGRRKVPWVAEPGTRCVILGYWSDGTVHLRWPAIKGAYRVDGRFPAWVVEADLDTRLAGGGHMLDANDPVALARGLSPWLIAAIVIAVVLLIVLFLLVSIGHSSSLGT
jgi:hypothetical protein